MHNIISLFLLAHSSFAATLAKRALAPDSTLPSGWEYSGCYTDSVYSRTLNSDFVFDMGTNTLTADTCIVYCSSRGYPVAGTEYAAECFCGTGVPLQTGTDGCGMACAGDSTQACGGPDRLSVYANFATNPGPEGWASLGCYTDNVQARTLANLEQVAGGSDALTVSLCTTTCGNLGFTYAGVEYAGECFCGNELLNGGAPFAGGCGMLCKGNATEFCGGPDRLNLYQAIPLEEPEPEPTTIEVSMPIELTSTGEALPQEPTSTVESILVTESTTATEEIHATVISEEPISITVSARND